MIKTIALKNKNIKLITTTLLAFALLVVGFFITQTSALAEVPTTWTVDTSATNECTVENASNTCKTIQAAVNLALAGDTIEIIPGTYNENIVVKQENLTIKGMDTDRSKVIINLGAGYGIEITNHQGFTLENVTVNASAGTTYALKAYKADEINISNTTFDGRKIAPGVGGVDFNTTSNITINNVTSTGFTKNGFSFVSKYQESDPESSNINISNITATNNGGLFFGNVVFYTVGADKSLTTPSDIGGSGSFSNVHFTGNNTISNSTWGLLLIGTSDHEALNLQTPTNTITSDGTTLNLNNISFSNNGNGTTGADIFNYQTAPVLATNATFNGKTGNLMDTTERTAQDKMIRDQKTPNFSFLGLVTYYDTPSVVTEEATNVTESNATLSGTNGLVAGQNHTIWVSLTPITSFETNPITADIYSTPALGSIPPNKSFSYELSDLTTNGADGKNLPEITVGTTYYYVAWVKVNDDWYHGEEKSFTTSVVIPSDPLTIPTLLSPANNSTVSGSSVTQSWSDSDPRVDHYIYESYHDDQAELLRWHKEYTTTSKTATNIADATYWWRVKAVDVSGNESEWSDLWKLTIDNSPVTPPSPTLTITAPEENGEVAGEYTFKANYENGPTNSISWAIRKYSHTCSKAGGAIVAGNVDGKHDVLDFNNSILSVTLDTTDWGDGEHCFVINPTNVSSLRVIQNFTINNTSTTNPGDVNDDEEEDGDDTTTTQPPAPAISRVVSGGSFGGGGSTGSITGGEVLGAETFQFTQYLKLGSRGGDVPELQKYLNEAGYNSGIVDGIFGPITRKAVIAFQKVNNLIGDGIVGPLTRAVLNSR